MNSPLHPGSVISLVFAVGLAMQGMAAGYFEAGEAIWKLRDGSSNASQPATAWRERDFNDETWSDAHAPIYYSSSGAEPPFFDGGVFTGTEIDGMMSNYSTVFLRKSFVVQSAGAVSELHLVAACDDGFIAWINGVEVARYNVDAGEPTYDGIAGNSVNEPASVETFVVSNPTMLVNGTNVIAVQVFNAALDSSDIGFMAGLSAPVDMTAPSVQDQLPPAGSIVGELTQIEVRFSEVVTGVDGEDLIVNGQAAANVSGSGLGPYMFTFPQPAAGLVSVSWGQGNEIQDGSGNKFGGGSWNYTLNTSFVVPMAQITEFMASNSDTLADEDGDFPDWVEIYNPRQVSLNLSNWCLTDSPGNLTRWRFPDVLLGPGGRLVVFASGKNRTTNNAALHANFSLSNDGEYLGLVMPNGVTVVSEFAPRFPSQMQDVTYGAIEDGGANAYLFEPTPGAPNSPALGAELVADTKFSPTRGLFDAPLQVTITTATAGATIRYTVDGSVPTATHGTIYVEPIPVTRSLAIRAAAFKAGMVPANVDTHTYVLPNAVLEQAPGNSAPSGWPDDEVNGQRFDYEMDARIVNHSNTNIGGRTQVLAALRALPSMSIVLPQQDFSGVTRGIYANAQQRGREWERAASVELLNDPEHGGFHSGAGLRIRGNFSRDSNNPKHSFRLVFRSEYGDSLLRYPLYGKNGAREFNAIDVQTPQDFSWAYYEAAMCNYVRDTWSRDTQGDMGQPYARSRWVQLYINGIYWGIYQVEERPEAKFAANYLGGESEEYDVIKNAGFAEDFHIEAADGLLTGPTGKPSAWERLFAGTRAHNASPNEATYFALQGLLPDGMSRTNASDAVLLDADNLADWLLMVMYSANHDMGSSVWVSQKPNNFWGVRRRGGDRGFAWIAHDGETSMDFYPVNYDRTGPVNVAIREEFVWSNPEFFHNDLLASLEWRTKFGDRAHRALYNSGALSPEKAVARLDRRQEELQLAIIAESARWGDAQSATDPYNRMDWLRKVDDTRRWLLARREYLVTQLREDGLYPTVAAPNMSQFGGEFSVGTQITLSAPAGTIYYTLDGGDPRLPGGDVYGNAKPYAGAITLTRTMRLQARARVGNAWSALVEANFVKAQDANGLRITEVMYNPPEGAQFEFIELKNTGVSDLDLGGFVIDGISHTITNGTLLSPGAFLVLVKNATNFASKYSTALGGVYSGSLDNAGERIVVRHPLSHEEVVSVDYENGWPWPVLADGHGFSIVPQNAATASAELGWQWRASANVGGSPGVDDPTQDTPGIVINEVLARSLNNTNDQVELHNTNAVVVDVSGWWLSDERGQLRKYRIPNGTSIEPRGFLIVRQEQFGVAGSVVPFDLDDDGEVLYITAASTGSVAFTGWSHAASYPRTHPETSAGRVVTSDGYEHWVEMQTPTFGTANAFAKVGPIVISEVHARALNEGEQFVEIHNADSTNVPLFDTSTPGSAWRMTGLDFTFSTNVTMSPGETSLIVKTNPVAFRQQFGVPSSVQVFGPFEGTLNSEGEVLTLQATDRFETDGLTYIVIDQTPVWGTNWSPGKSITRRTPLGQFGAEPLNWSFEIPSPGVVPTQEAGPKIVQGPLSQSVAASEAFTLSVSMAGGFPTYQSIWSRDGVILLTNVATTTNAFFTETAPAVPGIYSYMVEVRGGANPTPSRASANIAVMADMDSDGLPDEWEKIFGLSDADPADAALDGDNDGLDNRQEYAAGTNPTDGLSKLSLEIAVGSVAILRFEGIQNKTYSLEFTDALGEGSWVKFSDHAAQASTRWETASDALVSNRYYRLVIPRKP